MGGRVAWNRKHREIRAETRQHACVVQAASISPSCRARYRAAFARFPHVAMEHQVRRPPLLVSTNQRRHPSARHRRSRLRSTELTSRIASSTIGASEAAGWSPSYVGSSVCGPRAPATTRDDDRVQPRTRFNACRVGPSTVRPAAVSPRRVSIETRSCRASVCRTLRSDTPRGCRSDQAGVPARSIHASTSPAPENASTGPERVTTTVLTKSRASEPKRSRSTIWRMSASIPHITGYFI